MKLHKGFVYVELLIASIILSFIVLASMRLQMEEVRIREAERLADLLVAFDQAVYAASVAAGDYLPLGIAYGSYTSSPSGNQSIGPLGKERLLAPLADTWRWSSSRDIPRNFVPPRVLAANLGDYVFYINYVSTTEPGLINIFEVEVYRRGNRPLEESLLGLLSERLGEKGCVGSYSSGRFFRYFLGGGAYYKSGINCAGIRREGYHTVRGYYTSIRPL